MKNLVSAGGIPTGTLAPLPQYMQELIDATNELIIKFTVEYENLADAVKALEDHVDNHQKYAVPHPDVWLPLTSDIHLKEGFGCTEFSRAGKATYTDKSGDLRVAEVDEPRFGKEGLLVEGESTNKLLHSETRAGAGGWNTIGAPTISHDSETGFNVTTVIATSKTHTVMRQAITNQLSDNTIYCLSVLLKKSSASQWLQLTGVGASNWKTQPTIFVNSATGDHQTDSHLGHGVTSHGAYWKVQITGETGIIDSQIDWALVLRGDSDTALPDEGDTLTFKAPQVEPRSFATSYIPTEDSPATRVREDLEVEAENNLTTRIGDKTISCSYSIDTLEADGEGANARRHLWGSNDQFIGAFLYYNKNSEVLELQAFDGDATIISAGIPNNAMSGTVCVVKVGNTLSIYFNGELLNSGTVGEYVQQNNDFFRIGHSGVTSMRRLWGRLRNLRIWHKPFTPEQVKTIA